MNSTAIRDGSRSIRAGTRRRFVESGFLHILEGVDHLLFLLCLVIPFRRFGSLVLIGHTGWHWMLERAERLSQFPWPVFDAAMLASAMRWLMAALLLAAAAWFVNTTWVKRQAGRGKLKGDG